MKHTLLITLPLILLLSGCQQAASPTATVAPTETAEPTEVPEIALIGDQEIAFSSEITGNEEIYVINADGSGLLQVTHLPDSDEFFPQWSPNGKMISFFSGIKGSGGFHHDTSLVTISNEGVILLELDSSECGFPIWSPDSNWFLVTCAEDVGEYFREYVLVMRPNGTDQIRLEGITRTSPSLIHWTQDSRCVGIEGYGLLIYCVDGTSVEIDASAISGRTATGPSNGFDWAPDGTRLVFIQRDVISADFFAPEYSPSYVMLVNSDGTNSRRITPVETQTGYSYPVWISANEVLLLSGVWEVDTWRSFISKVNVETLEIVEYQVDLAYTPYAISPSKQLIAFVIEDQLWLTDLMTGKSHYLISHPDFGDPTFLNENQVLLENEGRLHIIDVLNGSERIVTLPVPIDDWDIRKPSN